MNGYHVPCYQAGEFASTIDRVLKNELLQMSENAKMYVNEKFSWDFVISQYLNFLKKVYTSN